MEIRPIIGMGEPIFRPKEEHHKSQNAIFDNRYINEEHFEEDKQKILHIIQTTQYNPDIKLSLPEYFSTQIFGNLSEKFILKINYNEYNFDVSYGASCTFNAHLDEDGILSMDAYLVKFKGEEQTRHPYMPHFNKLFSAALNYYSRQGRPVKGVYGSWLPSNNDNVQINYLVYENGLHAGLTPQEAALLTPTGKVASKYGFTKVSLDDENYSVTDDDNVTVGVGFLFEKEIL